MSSAAPEVVVFAFVVSEVDFSVDSSLVLTVSSVVSSFPSTVYSIFFSAFSFALSLSFLNCAWVGDDTAMRARQSKHMKINFCFMKLSFLR
jgi:hypothetical protein